MGRISPTVLIVLVAIALFGCLGGGGGETPVNVTNATNTTNGTWVDYNQTTFTCDDGSIVTDPLLCPANLCPSSCDDNDVCTTDKCGKTTGYECAHEKLVPCCGNGLCEEGESTELCPKDCGSCPPSCEDSNPCTLEKCGSETGFACVLEPVSGNALGCSGYVGVSGYSNVRYGFSASAPEGWKLDEESKANSGGVVFLGPDSNPGCYFMAFRDKGRYVDILNGFSFYPPANWTTTKLQGFDGVVFARPGSAPGEGMYVSMDPTSWKSVFGYASDIRKDYVYASETSSGIISLGKKLANITVSETNYTIDGLDAYEFVITGSVGTGNSATDEMQKHAYVLKGGFVYDIALSGNSSAYGSMLQDFTNSLGTFSLMTPAKCPSGGFAPRISVYTREETLGYSLDDYVQHELSLISRAAGYSLIEISGDTLDGRPAKGYSAFLVSDGFPIRRGAAVLSRKGKYYRIEYDALPGDFDLNFPSFRSVVKSFKTMGSPTGCKAQTCVEGTCSVQSVPGCCGNWICEEGEDCDSCPSDCGICTPKYPPLQASIYFRPGDAHYYSTLNCEPFLVRVRVDNPLSEPMTIYSEGALAFRSTADSTCRAEARSVADCIATMNGDFGEENTVNSEEKSLILYGYGGTGQQPQPGAEVYSTTLKFNVTNQILWVGPSCMHFYCIPTLTKSFKGNTYVMTGVEGYLGDIQFGNWWCHANRSLGENLGYEDLYFQRFYNRTCVVTYGPYGKRESERCYDSRTG